METTQTNYHDFLNAYYNDLYSSGADNNRNQHCTNAIIEHLDATRENYPELKCLDIGFGRGALLKYFNGRGWNAVGVEIAIAPSHTELVGLPRVELSYCNFLTFETRDVFDLVVDNGTFHHQHPRDRSSYLSNITELMSEEAEFLITAYKVSNNVVPSTEILQDGRFKLSLDDDLLSLIMKEHCASLKIVQSVPIVRKGRLQNCVLFVLKKQR